MQKVRNLLLVGCAAVLLCATLGCRVVTSLGISLPIRVAPTQERWNYLEGRAYTQLPALSTAGFLDGSFQSALESYLTDSVPFRSNLLLANASLQRRSIIIMANLMGYTVYPTFFSSDIVYSSTNDGLYQMPLTQDRCNVRAMEKSLHSYDEFAKSHPDLRCFFAMPTRSNALSFEPFTSLVSRPVTNQFYNDVISSSLGDSITKVDIAITSFDDLTKEYFRTDHHWNIDGAYKGYQTLATALGYGGELAVHGEPLQYGEAQFNGSNARSGLKAAQNADDFMDYEFELPAYDLTVNGKSRDASYLADFPARQNRRLFESPLLQLLL